MKHRVAALAAALAVSAGGVVLIKHHEGRPSHGYKDPVGIVTACYGHTKTAVLGKKYTEADCERLLKQDLADTEAAIKRLVKVPLAQGQYDALVSFVFNVGPTAFANSTLLRKLNARDCTGAANEFPRWDKAGGKSLTGLAKRRADERKKFIEACHVPNKTSYAFLHPGSDAPPSKVPTSGHSADPFPLRREMVGSV